MNNRTFRTKLQDCLYLASMLIMILTIGCSSSEPSCEQNPRQGNKDTSGLYATKNVSTECPRGKASIDINVEGPNKIVFGQIVTYLVHLSNTGSILLREVAVEASFPDALRFIETSDNGEFVPQEGIIKWVVNDIPANSTKTLKFTGKVIRLEPLRVQAYAKSCR